LLGLVRQPLAVIASSRSRSRPSLISRRCRRRRRSH
jgi:hypothetical protein